MKEAHWYERRHNTSKTVPTLYLVLEALLLLLLTYTLSAFHQPIITDLAAIVAIGYFLLSCLPRYHKILARQEKIRHTKQNLYRSLDQSDNLSFN